MRRFVFIIFLLHSTSGFTNEIDLQNKAKQFFQSLRAENMDQEVPRFYDQKVEFKDPIHQLQGEKAVREYYRGLYKNVSSIHFDFLQSFQDKDTVVLVWKMNLKTPKLNGGHEFSVDGNSVIKFNQDSKAIYHRDYFDMGEFIYERTPVLGFVIKKIKERLGHQE